MMTKTDATAAYLRTLERSLLPLPADERSSIVHEIEIHIRERLMQGVSEPHILAALGEPADMARAYLEQEELARALAAPSPARLLVVILNRAGRSVVNFVIGLICLSLLATGTSFLAVAVLKLIAPQHVGFWTTKGGVDFGAMAAPPTGVPERLGFWIIPISLVAAVISYLAAMAILRGRAGSLLRRAPVLPNS